MRTTLRLALSSSALALAGSPAVAQNAVQDFQLPDPNATPTPTPRAQGPVDDTGVVPVAPRVLPTEGEPPASTATPSPSPSSAPTQTEPARDTSEATVQPLPQPRATTSPATRGAIQPAPSPAPSQAVAPAAAAGPASGDVSDSSATPSEMPTLGESIPTGSASTASSTASGTDEPPSETASNLADFWPWIIAAIVAALAVIAGWFFLRRRGQAEAPTIEAPQVTPAGGLSATRAVAEPARFAVSLNIESAMRSVMMVMVKYRLSIANRSETAMRDVKVSADIISARRDVASDGQLANAATELPQMNAIERIGPHQTQAVTGTLQLSKQDIEVLRQASKPMFVPLLRIRVEGTGFEPFIETYAVGIGGVAGSTRVNPLPLDGPPGSYDGVRAKPLATQTA